MPSIPERLATVEAEARHTRELIERHAEQSNANFALGDRKQQELAAQIRSVDEKIMKLLSAFERGKGGVLAFGAAVAFVGGALGEKTLALVHNLFK